MKQFLIDTFLGNFFLQVRDKFQLLRVALLFPEAVGTLANDQLATKLITRLCLPGKVFIDVGAHIGSIISLARQHDRTIEIVAIEAIPEKIASLRKKFEDITFHECAVGEEEGEVSFFINTEQSGYSSLKNPVAGATNSNIEEITVPMRKLDNLIDSKNVDAIKIDVEGFELGVLRGCENLLEQCRPVIMFESGPGLEGSSSPYSKEDMWDFFTLHNYQILLPNRVAHNDEGLMRECFVESHAYPRRTTNYFAIPGERRLDVRDRARALLKVKTTGTDNLSI